MKKKGVILLFVFTVFFSKLETYLAAKMWRYYPAASYSHGYITTRTKFILEYTGSVEWTQNSWYSEDHCHVENETSPSATVICSTTGYHPFGILDQSLTKMDLENILVIKTPYCYEWKIGLVSFSVNSSLSTVNLKFQLWIQKMDETKKNNTSPTETSKRMTKLFYQIGQRPSVHAFASHASDELMFVRQEVLFSANGSVWDADLVIKTPELLKIKIEESTVGFLDCFIKATVFEIPDKKYSIAEYLNVTQSSVYLSLNTTMGFLPVNVPSYFQDEGFRLLDVKLNGICDCVFYLIESSTCPQCNGTKIIGYTTQDNKTNTWDNVTLLIADEQHIDNGGNWSFQFLPPNSFSMLVWNSHDVFYKSGEGWYRQYLPGEQKTTLVAKKGAISSPGDENILQVVTSNNGEYLVLYEDLSVCYGRIGVDYMIQLNSSFANNDQIRLVFDPIGNAYVVSLSTSSPSVIKKNFALDNEIFNALYPDVYCPFIQFSFGILSSSNVLDRWEQFEIWGYLVYTRSYSNDIELIWNPAEDLLLTVSERKEYYQDVIMLNKTFTFKERKAENSTFTTPSSFSLTLLPKLLSMTCRRPFHKVFHFHTGCPPTRRTFVRDARWSEVRPVTEEEEAFSLRLSSSDVFYPAIVMYDNDVLIGNVFSTFVVTELNGKTGFAVRMEQGSIGDKTIMSFDGSGSYRFSLSFEDKNVSFCKTVLEFDVYVSEERVTNYFYVEFACVTFITMLFIVFLIFDYILYRKEFLQRHEEDDEAKNRLQELQYLAQLQYYRAGSTPKRSPSVISATTSEETKRRAALVTGKKDRGSRRSSVFERVSKGIFQDLKVQERSKSLQDPLPEIEEFNNLPSSSRRNTIAQ